MSEPESEALLERFENARDRYEAARAAVDEVGEEALEELADHLRQLDRTLETYEEGATGSGDFGSYIAFRDRITGLVESLPEDLPHREAFEDVDEQVDKRRLTSSDFESARAAVKEPRAAVERLEELDTARAAYRERRRDIFERIDALDERIDELDRVIELGEADIDAPVEELRTPIETYNEGVGSAFRDFQRSAPAVDVLDLFALGDQYPLIHMRRPPTELHRYVRRELEEATVTDLLEYAQFSRSKLAHFVDDPSTFKAKVATEQTYLERLDATPFRISWPPPSASALRWRLRELIPVVGRFAPDGVIRDLRRVRELTRDAARFDDLRAAAEARAELSPEQREQLVAGEVTEQRAAVIATRERLAAAIQDAPDV